MPVVSVLMPCYNAAATLDEALESLAGQTLLDFEVVVVEDGSTDTTLDILRNWAESRLQLRIIQQPHRGIIQALNRGLAACQAPLAARMDADDRCLPKRLEKQVAYLNDHPGTAVCGCMVRGFPTNELRQGLQIYITWLNSLVSDEEIRREIFIESPLAHPSVMFRAESIRQVGGYQEHGWPEDYDLWLRLYLAGARFGKVPEVLMEWRDAPERLTRTDTRYSLENFLRLKARYLMQGPLEGREAVLIWGAGMIGRRLSKHLLRLGCPLQAFVDIDPHKIGHSRRGLPILGIEKLMPWWQNTSRPAVLAAVGARGAKQLIRQRLNGFGLVEGQDWWCVA